MNEKLYLGCGPLPINKQHLQIIDGTWTLIDLYVRDPSIINMDARHLKYPDNSVEKVYTSHLLEHIGLREIDSTLKEWHRALKPEGELIINVPDMEWVAEQLLSFGGCLTNQIGKNSKVFNSPEKLMEVIYGNQEHDGEYHKSGFTKRTLESYLSKAGFKDILIKSIFEAHDMNCLMGKAKK